MIEKRRSLVIYLNRCGNEKVNGPVQKSCEDAFEVQWCDVSLCHTYCAENAWSNPPFGHPSSYWCLQDKPCSKSLCGIKRVFTQFSMVIWYLHVFSKSECTTLTPCLSCCKQHSMCHTIPQPTDSQRAFLTLCQNAEWRNGCLDFYTLSNAPCQTVPTVAVSVNWLKFPSAKHPNMLHKRVYICIFRNCKQSTAVLNFFTDAYKSLTGVRYAVIGASFTDSGALYQKQAHSQQKLLLS